MAAALSDRQSPPAGPSSTSSFLTLPTELKIEVVKNLAKIGDLKNVRLISRDWAAAGAPLLFRNGFTIRPHHRDMLRLQSVCNHPEIAKGIKHLDIFVGDTSEEQFFGAISRQQYLSPRAVKSISKICRALFSPSEKTHCARNLLGSLFQLLPNVTSIAATSSKCPFSDSDSDIVPLRAIWEDMDDYCEEYGKDYFYDPTISKLIYSNILLAAQHSQVQKLALEAFPLDCFLRKAEADNLDDANLEVDVPKMDEMRKAVVEIKELFIGVIDIEADLVYEGASLGRSMGNFFGSMQQLRSLDLSWELDLNFENLDRAWTSTLYKSTFPFLESLRLTYTDVSDVVLAPFLYRHTSTLKRLHLGEDSIHLSKNNSYRNILNNCREHLKLEKFELVDRQDLSPLEAERIYDEGWNPIKFSKKVPPRDAKLLEMFVLGKCPWPMVGDDPQRGGKWKRKFMGSHLEFLQLSGEDLDDLLGGEWKTDSSSSSSDADSVSDEEDSEEDESEEDSDDDTDMAEPDTDGGPWVDLDSGQD